MEICSQPFVGMPGRSGSLDSKLDSALLNAPHSICQISQTQYVISDSKNDALRLVDTSHGLVATVQCTVPLSRPKGLARLGNDLLVVNSADSSLKILRGSNGDLDHFAGLRQGYQDGQVRKARFDRPSSVCVSPIDKTIYVADQYNQCIRYIETEYVRPDLEQLFNANPTGEMYWAVETLAGTPGRPAFQDRLDELSERSASFSTPVQAIALNDGNLLVVDQANNALRHIHVGTGIVTTVVGKRGQYLTGKCTFHKNPNYSPQALDIVDRYRVLLELKKPRVPIEDAADHFRAPCAVLQLPSGALLCACLGREIWIINPAFTDMRPIPVRGELGIITDIRLDEFDGARIHAVDSTRHCVWNLDIREQLVRTQPVQARVITAEYENTKLHMMRRSGVVGATSRPSSTHASHVRQARTEHVESQQKQIEPLQKTALSETTDQRICRIIGRSAAEARQALAMGADVFKGLTADQETALLKEFASITSWKQQAALFQALQLFAAQHILSNAWLQPLSSLDEVLTGVAMAGFLAVGISVEDVARRRLLECRSREFQSVGEEMNVEIVLVAGQWALEGTGQRARIKVLDQQAAVQGVQKEARFGDKKYEGTALVQYSSVAKIRARDAISVPVAILVGTRKIELEFKIVPGQSKAIKRPTLQDVCLFYCFE